MKRLLLTLILLFSGLAVQAQRTHLPDLAAPDGQDPIAKKPLHSDAHVTSVVLWISGEIRLHRHDAHSEHVVVLGGRGIMRLGEETFTVRKGDIIFIPQGTPHAVRVDKGVLKVVSIQAPEFDGSDRVPLE